MHRLPLPARCPAPGIKPLGLQPHELPFQAAGLCGKPLAAFEPAAGQYVAAVGRFHPFAEAMDFFALPLFGLVSLKHGLHLFSLW